DGNATNALQGTSGSVITITPKPATEPTIPSLEPEPVIIPTPEIDPVIAPEPTIVVTPTEIPVEHTTTIRTKDLFTLVYILIGIIFMLLGVIIALIVVIIRKKPPVRKPRTKKEKEEKEEVRLSGI